MNRQQRRAAKRDAERGRQMPGKSIPVGTLTGEEIGQLRQIEAELGRLVMTHSAMLSLRENAMVTLVRSRGFDPTVEDYSLDLDHGLILQVEKEPDPGLSVVPDEPPDSEAEAAAQ